MNHTSPNFPPLRSACVVGIGYIGLPTAVCAALSGLDVTGVDVKASTVDRVNKGILPQEEPGLAEALRKAVRSGLFRASLKPVVADLFLICVPTPFDPPVDGIPQPGMQFVIAAAKSIASVVKPGDLVMLESTSPVGSTELIRDTLAGEGVDVSSLLFAYCPERIIPGRMMQELAENDRVIGGLTPEAAERAAEFYGHFVKGELCRATAREAEMVKLVENSFRDVNLAFANEISMLCDELGISDRRVIELANHHPRVNILSPGCGVGGHCIAVDPWFIVAKSPEKARIIHMARLVNDSKPEWVIEKILDACRKTGLEKPVVSVLGLTFKADVDDSRNSPAKTIAERLAATPGATWLFSDPHIQPDCGLPLTPFRVAIGEADVIVVLIGHTAFRGLAGRKVDATVLDFCGLES